MSGSLTNPFPGGGRNARTALRPDRAVPGRSAAGGGSVAVQESVRQAVEVDLDPQRAPVLDLVVAAQLHQAAERTQPAGERRLVLVEPAVHEGQPGAAVGVGQLPGLDHVAPVDRHRTSGLEVDDLCRVGVGLETAHRPAAARAQFVLQLHAGPAGELLRVGQRLVDREPVGVDQHVPAQHRAGEVAPCGGLPPLGVVGQVAQGQRPEGVHQAAVAGVVHQHLGPAENPGVGERQQRRPGVRARPGPARQGDVDGGGDAVELPVEPQRAVVQVPQNLVRRLPAGGEAPPEPVPVGQFHLGLLGQPDPQRRRVGQGAVNRPGRGGDPEALLQRGHRSSPCRLLPASSWGSSWGWSG